MEQKQGSKQGLGQTLLSDWPLILIILCCFIAGAVLYSHMPERVPGHWNFKGEVDRYTSRFGGAFSMPLVTTGIYIMLLVLPLIDPRRENYQKFTGAYRVMKFILVVFMAFIYLVTMLSTFGYNVPVGVVTMAGVSLLFIVLGNYMGQIRHNYFVGIKTPWTLANEQVWQKTHRLGGKLWVAAGLISLVASLIGGITGWIIMGVSLGIATVIPIIYSYLEFRRETKNTG